MKKVKYYKKDIEDLRNTTRHILTNKYFNLFMDSLKWNGLEDEQEDYIMKKFWSDGTVSAFNIKGIDELGFAPYAVSSYTMYDTPSTVNLINERNVPFIPTGNLTVNQDVVLGWVQRNHKSIYTMVSYYVEKLVEVEMVINTNLQVNKLPLLIGVTPSDKENAEHLVNKILNDEVAIFANLDELNLVKTLSNGSQYILDKLYAFKNNIESELLTYLGIDNSQIDVDKLAVDQINANNEMINSNAEGYLNELNKFCKRISEVLNKTVSVELTHNRVMSEHANMDHENEVTKEETGGTL